MRSLIVPLILLASSSSGSLAQELTETQRLALQSLTSPDSGLRDTDEALATLFGPGIEASDANERAQLNYEARMDRLLERIQERYGDGAMLQEAQRMRREFTPLPPERILRVDPQNVEPDPQPPQQELPRPAEIIRSAEPNQTRETIGPREGGVGPMGERHQSTREVIPGQRDIERILDHINTHGVSD